MHRFLRYTLFPAAALAAGCASQPPAASMTLTPAPCETCIYGVPEYSYGSPYPYYPVIAVPVYPVTVPPPPVQKPPVTPPPPPKIRVRAPVERPCPKSDKVCP
ncbi:MAG TPA: hypothetical protein VGT99_05740 [Gammaproteobacteria bacterium]|nr:hypothetical protein [Gammaproteobacteria bacterium]